MTIYRELFPATIRQDITSEEPEQEISAVQSALIALWGQGSELQPSMISERLRFSGDAYTELREDVMGFSGSVIEDSEAAGF